jgi:hypothetical protein
MNQGASRQLAAAHLVAVVNDTPTGAEQLGLDVLRKVNNVNFRAKLRKLGKSGRIVTGQGVRTSGKPLFKGILKVVLDAST